MDVGSEIFTTRLKFQKNPVRVYVACGLLAVETVGPESWASAALRSLKNTLDYQGISSKVLNFFFPEETWNAN